jgi:hypothetical protein
MLFCLIAVIASVSFFSQGTIAQVTVEQVADNLGTVASVSLAAEDVLIPITTSSSGSDVQTAAEVG